MRSLPALRNVFLALATCLIPAAASAGVFVSVNFAPPALPIYAQPACPVAGYLWTPGYWGYGPGGYYWVPGVWIAPPQPGFLWTPGYWGFAGGVYSFNAGYWGPRVGFYGGVNYGFGYGGIGFEGGRWEGNRFLYNTAYSRVNTTVIHNTYNRTVVNNVVVNNRVSYNGGPGGVAARPSPQQLAFSRDQRVQPTAEQVSHREAAGANRAQFASVNHGRPAMAAVARPGEFNNRRADQQNRIANGVRSGQLTPGETRNLENRQANINRQANADRQANNGRLNQQERQQLNREQNRASGAVNREKHDANTAQQPEREREREPR
ncbi:MAG: hypothetical protein M3Y07_07775 [Acidobacteriota bacterium]|nr:hypothetical protein [Acidobacteriota bacterium]